MARDPKGFRLSFPHTNAKKFASTMKQARADVRYWLTWGVTKVCIERKVTKSHYVPVKCYSRGRR